MNTAFKGLFCLLFFCAYLVYNVGCGGRDSVQQTIRIGVVAPLEGPNKTWGESTLFCARIIADYYNEQGGYKIGGQRYLIELIEESGNVTGSQAIPAINRLLEDHEVTAIIGPTDDDAVNAVAPILDAANVAYVHYGYDSDLIREDSSGILGMPIPEQTLPVIYNYLMREYEVESVSVLASQSNKTILQKHVAEALAEESGLVVKNFATFDVAEEAFDPNVAPDVMEARMHQLLAVNPDAVVATSLPPEELLELAKLLRRVGYQGLIVAQNAQDMLGLYNLGAAANGLVFVGGHGLDGDLSDYYLELETRYISLAGSLSYEFDNKIYALEFLLALIASVGPEALNNASYVADALELDLRLRDPFFNVDRWMQLTGVEHFGVAKQINVPIFVSEFRDGKVSVVYPQNLSQ